MGIRGWCALSQGGRTGLNLIHIQSFVAATPPVKGKRGGVSGYTTGYNGSCTLRDQSAWASAQMGWADEQKYNHLRVLAAAC